MGETLGPPHTHTHAAHYLFATTTNSLGRRNIVASVGIGWRMCVIFWTVSDAHYDLVIASNRDEFLARPRCLHPGMLLTSIRKLVSSVPAMPAVEELGLV